MRVLIVSQYFWPENFRINDLASELISRGHEVTVLTGLPNYPDGRIFAAYQENPKVFSTFEGAPVFRVPIIPRGNTAVRLVLNYLSFVVSGLFLGARALRGKQFDAIFVFQTSPITSALPALWLRRRKHAPLLMWVLDLWPETLEAIGVVRSPLLLSWVGALAGFIYRRCDRILIQSRAFAENVVLQGGDQDRIRYLPGWAEAVFASGSEIVDSAPELAPYRTDFRLVFAGNIGEAQDFPTLIEAAGLLRDVEGLRIIVVGEGRAAPAMREEVVRRGLSERIVFLGRFPLERMPGFFNAADALLVSLRDEPIWARTIPGKVQSYLAAGRPIIGMLNGEGSRVIDEAGAGLTGPAGDACALAGNIRRMMSLSDEARRELGKAGRAYCAREFERGMLIDRVVCWIEELRRGDGRMH
jgi:glycosyltransferase involved in cell wall biosynthesis